MTARTVLITGGSSGIGAAAARLLLATGHRVAVTGRSKEKLDAFLDEVGRSDELLGITADATDWHSTEAAVVSTVEPVRRPGCRGRQRRIHLRGHDHRR